MAHGLKCYSLPLWQVLGPGRSMVVEVVWLLVYILVDQNSHSRMAP